MKQKPSISAFDLTTVDEFIVFMHALQCNTYEPFTIDPYALSAYRVVPISTQGIQRCIENLEQRGIFCRGVVVRRHATRRRRSSKAYILLREDLEKLLTPPPKTKIGKRMVQKLRRHDVIRREYEMETNHER